jgi:hypothetical protein
MMFIGKYQFDRCPSVKVNIEVSRNKITLLIILIDLVSKQKVNVSNP